MSESWVDVPKNEIPHPSTWNTLSTNALLDVKNQLLNKLAMARGKPMYLTALNNSLAQLDAIISAKTGG
jgi:hypothetical protein